VSVYRQFFSTFWDAAETDIPIRFDNHFTIHADDVLKRHALNDILTDRYITDYAFVDETYTGNGMDEKTSKSKFSFVK